MKIKEKFNQKDIVVCEAAEDRLTFSYLPVGTQRRILLYTDRFSPSVFRYFRKTGRSVSGGGYCLTMRELYSFHDFRNVRLTKTITSRLPMMIQYVLREEQELKPARAGKKTSRSRSRDWDWGEYAA